MTDPQNPQQPDPRQSGQTSQGGSEQPWQSGSGPSWQGGPGQPPPQWQGSGRYPQQPPKKRTVWPWVLGIVAVIMLAVCGGCLAFMGVVGNEIAEEEENRTSVRPAGSEVRDGKFSFVVTRVDPPVIEVGDNEIMRETAQGEFILVHVEVTNTANEPQTYFSENQKLIDDQGREYTNDSMAEMNVNSPNMITEINPGNTLSTVIVFDVPRDTVPAAIEFHDSTFSGGVRVALK